MTTTCKPDKDQILIIVDKDICKIMIRTCIHVPKKTAHVR